MNADCGCKKGISLPIEQFSNILSLLPEIEIALEDKGVEVKRPLYGGAGEKAVKEGVVEGEADGGGDDKGGKKNFEETSDEGE